MPTTPPRRLTQSSSLGSDEGHIRRGYYAHMQTMLYDDASMRRGFGAGNGFLHVGGRHGRGNERMSRTRMYCISTAMAIVAQLALAAGAACAGTLTVDSSTHMIGESTVYQITGAPANAEILWSSWKNGVSTGEVNAYYGQNTDANGNWNALAGPWPAGDVGGWKKQASIAGTGISVSFTIVERLTVNHPVYTVGQAPVYTISGALPNTRILWSSTLNGVSTGEVNAYYGQNTDATGDRKSVLS